MRKTRKNVSKKFADPSSANLVKLGSGKFELEPSSSDGDSLPWKMRQMIELSKKKSAGRCSAQQKPPSKLPNRKFTTRGLIGNLAPLKGMTRPMKRVPLFEQRPNESDKKFLKRVDRVTRECIQEHRFEEKYNVDVVRDSTTGKVQVIKRRSDDNNNSNNSKSAGNSGKAEKSGDKEDDVGQSEEKVNRKKLKQMRKQQRLENKVDEFAHLRDHVQFGEVVQRPPELSGPRRPAQTQSPRPSGSKRLLLRDKLKAPANQSRDLERERLRAINMYRKIKSSGTNQQQK